MSNPIVTTRHDSIFNARRALPVTIVGAGATGSRVFASLVELGCSQIQVIDFDKNKLEEEHKGLDLVRRDWCPLSKVRVQCMFRICRRRELLSVSSRDCRTSARRFFCECLVMHPSTR